MTVGHEEQVAPVDLIRAFRAQRIAEPRIEEDRPAAGCEHLPAGMAVPGERRGVRQWHRGRTSIPAAHRPLASSLAPMIARPVPACRKAPHRPRVGWPPPGRPGRPDGVRGHLGYTRAVPAERIAENLAFINWTVLTGLAIGSFVAVVLARLRTDATRGFLAFTVLAGVYVVALARRHRAPWIAAAGLFAAAATLVFGALAWAGGTVFAVPLLLQLVILAIATGGVFAAMILGHWYLVTPKLPEAPLILISRGLLAVVALQVVLFAVWVSTGTGPGVGAGPFSVLVGPWALFVWLRLIVGLIFPLVVSWAALQTARSRSMESATGLLYINVGTIAAGTILAAGLYFGAGLLV